MWVCVRRKHVTNLTILPSILAAADVLERERGFDSLSGLVADLIRQEWDKYHPGIPMPGSYVHQVQPAEYLNDSGDNSGRGAGTGRASASAEPHVPAHRPASNIHRKTNRPRGTAQLGKKEHS